MTELRILNAVEPNYRKPHTVSGYFDNPDALIDAIEVVQNASGFYLVPNPVNPDLLARAANRITVAKRGAGTTDANIIRRHWLLIDLDPVRPSGISSTDAEHEAAITRAREIAKAVSDLGFPAPILADSGNGAHLLYRIDLPTDDGGLVKRVLAALAFRFDDPLVVVDQTTHNPARIWKLYGTPARKGDFMPERPHRRSRLLQVPEVTQEVHESQLQALAASVPVPPSASTAQATTSHPGPTTNVADGLDVSQWLAEHHLQADGPIPWNGGRKWIFRICPWNPDHTNRSAFVVQFADGAIAAGCHHHGCRDYDWKNLRKRVEQERANCVPATTAMQDDDNEPAASWEPPVPFSTYPAPAFPTEALPDWMQEFVEALAVETQTPPDLAGLLTLTVCASAVAHRHEVNVRPGWNEPLNLYTVVALPPGTRKSAVFGAVVKPLTFVEAEQTEAMRAEIASARTARKILEERVRLAESEAAKAPLEQRAELEEAAEALASELASMSVPPEPRLVADDVSPEKLASLLAEQGGRIALLSPEGDVFDLMAGRYSANGAPNLGVYLKGHAGDHLRVDRMNRPSEYVMRPALTIGLAVQPQVLRGLMDKPGFRGRGLLGRFLYALPASPLGHRTTNAPPMPEHLRTTYEHKLRRLIGLPPARWAAEDGEEVPQLLRLTPEAHTRLVGFEDWIEPQLREFGTLAGMTDWAGKLAGAVIRLAGTLHLVEHGDATFPWATPISLETMERAITLGEYLLAHARAAYGEMGTDPVVEDARAIVRWIEQQTEPTVSKRDIFNDLRGRFTKVTEMDPAIRLLLEHGYLREEHTPGRAGPGRKPSPRYAVNPHLIAHITHITQNAGTTLAALTTKRRLAQQELDADLHALFEDEGTA